MLKDSKIIDKSSPHIKVFKNMSLEAKATFPTKIDFSRQIQTNNKNIVREKYKIGMIFTKKKTWCPIKKKEFLEMEHKADGGKINKNNKLVCSNNKFSRKMNKFKNCKDNLKKTKMNMNKQ